MGRIIALRHRIANDYFRLDLVTLWEIVQGDVPELIEMLEPPLRFATRVKRRLITCRPVFNKTEHEKSINLSFAQHLFLERSYGYFINGY